MGRSGNRFLSFSGLRDSRFVRSPDLSMTPYTNGRLSVLFFYRKNRNFKRTKKILKFIGTETEKENVGSYATY